MKNKLNNIFIDILYLVEEKANKKQSYRVRYCLTSIIDRLKHLDFHSGEIARISNLLIKSRGGIDSIFDEFNSVDKNRMIKIDAHAVAAVHGLHSISDILGQAIYLSLNDVVEWNGYLSDIHKKLPDDAIYVKQKINEFTTDSNFKYLNAIANQAKHRSIVKPVLMYSTTNAYPPSFQFSSFSKDKKNFGSKSIIEFFDTEISRQIKFIEEVGEGLCELIKNNNI